MIGQIVKIEWYCTGAGAGTSWPEPVKRNRLRLRLQLHCFSLQIINKILNLFEPYILLILGIKNKLKTALVSYLVLFISCFDNNKVENIIGMSLFQTL